MARTKNKKTLKAKIDRQAEAIARLQEENRLLRATLTLMGGGSTLTQVRNSVGDGIVRAVLVVKVPLLVPEGWKQDAWQKRDFVEVNVNVYKTAAVKAANSKEA